MAFDDGSFLVAEKQNLSVCKGRIRVKDEREDGTSAVQFTNTDDYPCKGPLLFPTPRSFTRAR